MSPFSAQEMVQLDAAAARKVRDDEMRQRERPLRQRMPQVQHGADADADQPTYPYGCMPYIAPSPTHTDVKRRVDASLNGGAL